jgi:hypothetical protein
VQDANYGVRWLKWKAPSWNGDASKVGIYGSSSGGHVAELLAMRPHDKRYNAIPLPEAPKIDATVAYVACRSPISDPFARFKNAEKNKRDGMVQNHYTYFKPWETIHESNPQEILERKEKVNLVPLLIMQGALDDNVLPAFQEKFVATVQGRGRRRRLSPVRRQRAPVGRATWAADRQGARDGQGVHRATAEIKMTIVTAALVSAQPRRCNPLASASSASVRQRRVVVADRHLHLRQGLGVEDLVFLDDVVDEQQVRRQRVDLVGGQRALSVERHRAIDVIPHRRRVRRAQRQDSSTCPDVGVRGALLFRIGALPSIG